MFPILNPPPSSLPIPSLWVIQVLTLPLIWPEISSSQFGCYFIANLWVMLLLYLNPFSLPFQFMVSFFLFFFYFIFKLYIIVLVLPNIKMNLSQVYMCSPSRTLLLGLIFGEGSKIPQTINKFSLTKLIFSISSLPI